MKKKKKRSFFPHYTLAVFYFSYAMMSKEIVFFFLIFDTKTQAEIQRFCHMSAAVTSCHIQKTRTQTQMQFTIIDDFVKVRSVQAQIHKCILLWLKFKH